MLHLPIEGALQKTRRCIRRRRRRLVRSARKLLGHFNVYTLEINLTIHPPSFIQAANSSHFC